MLLLRLEKGRAADPAYHYVRTEVASRLETTHHEIRCGLELGSLRFGLYRRVKTPAAVGVAANMG
eukprot:5949724-Pleurochrysis_carterae.AAC.1